MTDTEITLLNQFVVSLPKGKRKKLWDDINNSGKHVPELKVIDSLKLRESLKGETRIGLRWEGK